MLCSISSTPWRKIEAEHAVRLIRLFDEREIVWRQPHVQRAAASTSRWGGFGAPTIGAATSGCASTQARAIIVELHAVLARRASTTPIGDREVAVGKVQLVRELVGAWRAGAPAIAFARGCRRGTRGRAGSRE